MPEKQAISNSADIQLLKLQVLLLHSGNSRLQILPAAGFFRPAGSVVLPPAVRSARQGTDSIFFRFFQKTGSRVFFAGSFQAMIPVTSSLPVLRLSGYSSRSMPFTYTVSEGSGRGQKS